jgi:hypothetical protein
MAGTVWVRGRNSLAMVVAISRASIGSRPMLCSDELLRDLGTDLRPKCRRDTLVRGLSGGRVPAGDPFRYLGPERVGLAGVDLERRTQLSRCRHVCLSQVGGVQLVQPGCGEGVHAGAEEGPASAPQ